MQNQNLKKRVETLEKNLTPEQIAKIGNSIIEKTWDKLILASPKTSIEELKEIDEGFNKQMSEFVERYVDNLSIQDYIKYLKELHQLEVNKWGYEYFKLYLEDLETTTYYIASLVGLVECAKTLHEFVNSDLRLKKDWDKHVKKHPAAKDNYEFVRYITSKTTVKHLLELQAKIYENRERFLNSDIWDTLGYAKPTSIFEISTQSEEKE